jgi:hypothetical protein
MYMYGGHLSIGFSLFAWPDGISLKACDYRMGWLAENDDFDQRTDGLKHLKCVC